MFFGNNSLFSAQPAVSPDGTLTYTPAANESGSATVFVSLSDDGGKGSLMSSHPGSAKRAERAKEWADKEDGK